MNEIVLQIVEMQKELLKTSDERISTTLTIVCFLRKTSIAKEGPIIDANPLDFSFKIFEIVNDKAFYLRDQFLLQD